MEGEGAIQQWKLKKLQGKYEFDGDLGLRDRTKNLKNLSRPGLFSSFFVALLESDAQG